MVPLQVWGCEGPTLMACLGIFLWVNRKPQAHQEVQEKCHMGHPKEVRGLFKLNNHSQKRFSLNWPAEEAASTDFRTEGKGGCGAFVIIPLQDNCAYLAQACA